MSATPMTRRRSYDLLRILSIVGVVAIHVFGAIVADTSRSGQASWWIAVAVDIGFVWVVPLFVMLSGALVLAPRQYAAGTAAFYRRRLLRLAPAFVFWQVFYIVVFRIWLAPTAATPSAVVTSVLDGRPYTHLYFLWLIVGLYAVAPVLAAYLAAGGERRARWFAGIVLALTVASMAVSGLLTAVGVPSGVALNALTRWIPYVGFFLAGWALRDVVLRGWRLAFATGATLLVIGAAILQYGVRSELGILNAIAPVGYTGPLVVLATLGCFVVGNSLWAGWSPGPRLARVVTELSDAAFGVFLVHFAVMLLLRAVRPFSDTPGSVGLAFVQWALVVVISFAISVALRRVPGIRRLF